MSVLGSAARRLARMVALLALVAAGTMALMRWSPGYFADAREMDARYASSARAEVQAEEAQRGSWRLLAAETLKGWRQGDFGVSRQYEIPVRALVAPRLAVTASLLARGVACGWILAVCAALPLSTVRSWGGVLGAPFTVLLAVPTGVMATLCLLWGHGGPAVVLTLLLASRDFKFLLRVLREAWRAPHLIAARGQGLRVHQLARVHVLRNVLPRMAALATLSLVTALSAIVPIEVIFDLPGVGQLAWTAAMNRDLPVLLAVTMLLAVVMGLAGMVSHGARGYAGAVETA
jgi:peptide/nickel transport system permease protein